MAYFCLIACLATVISANPVRVPLKAYISYWGPQIDAYDSIPANSLAVINPDNGILMSKRQTGNPVRNAAAYRAIVDRARQRGVAMLGYVPTGYFRHDCNEIGKCQTWKRIERQVAAYFELTPEISGIFFDEAAPSNWNCEAFVGEYARLRSIVRRYSQDAIIAFNAGVPDDCVALAVMQNEIAVLFEGNPDSYGRSSTKLKASAELAHQRGAKVWHLVHSAASEASRRETIKISQQNGADYFYMTSRSGDWQSGINTWGRAE